LFSKKNREKRVVKIRDEKSRIRSRIRTKMSRIPNTAFYFMELPQDISHCRTTQIPVYDCKTNARVPNKFITISPFQVDVVLFEGILLFYFPKVSQAHK
jgi:pantothenate kinase